MGAERTIVLWFVVVIGVGYFAANSTEADEVTVKFNEKIAEVKARREALEDRLRSRRSVEEGGDLEDAEYSLDEIYDDHSSQEGEPLPPNPYLLEDDFLTVGNDMDLSLNRAVDALLEVLDLGVAADGEATLKLPNLNAKFGQGLTAGTFSASDGFFRNLSTLYRAGDAAVVKKGNTVNLKVALGLHTFEAGFAHYDLSILKVHKTGVIDLTIELISAQLAITFTFSPKCHFHVDDISFSQLGGLDVKTTGLDEFQAAFNLVSKWIFANFSRQLQELLNKTLREKAEKAVAKIDICKYVPF